MAVKKKVVKKKAVAKAPKKATTKSETITYLSEKTGLTKKDINAVFDNLGVLIKRDIKKSGPGVFTIPGLLKIKTVRKPAKRAQKNVPNPFKPGEFTDRPAKPAHTVVKIAALKALKDMV
ncbi:MAG: DNA-binding protein [Gammaproteobacteria bacterium]|nr:DNA-binding protein [Gammaproteobacteria bacterium]